MIVAITWPAGLCGCKIVSAGHGAAGAGSGHIMPMAALLAGVVEPIQEVLALPASRGRLLSSSGCCLKCF